MALTLVFELLFFVAVALSEKPLDNSSSLVADERLIPVVRPSLQGLQQSALSLLNRRNTQATASKCNAVTRQGVCIDAVECLTTNGEVGGLCNNRNSACCIYYTPSCNGRNERQIFTWISPPAPKMSCQISISDQKVEANTCQIRVDFDTFNIAGPDLGSVCSTDKLTVTGALNEVPVLCGNLVGQHMYLTPAAGKDIVMRIDVDVSKNSFRSWKIRMTRIACGSTDLAPDNCLQYFRAPTGVITSFNYLSVTNSADVNRQLANQNYNICIEKSKGYCSVCYNACPSILGKPNTVGFSVSGDTSVASATVSDTDCPGGDYLIINGGRDKATSTTTATKYCGGRLNAKDNSATDGVVCTNQSPFSLTYKTDGNEAGDKGNLGFCIEFQQVLC